MLVNGFRGSGETMNAERNLTNTWWMLRLTYGLVPIVAGLDKFTNLLVEWTSYVPGWLEGIVGDPTTFMYLVGVIEIVAGIGVLTRYTRAFAYVVAAWLVSIAVVLVTQGTYDVAVRDLAMAIGAVALGQLSTMPAVEKRQQSGGQPAT